MTPSQIRALRSRLKLSQHAFAELIGVDVMTVSRWERGIISPSRLAVKALAATSVVRRQQGDQKHRREATRETAKNEADDEVRH